MGCGGLVADVGRAGQWVAGDGPGRVGEVGEMSEAWGRREAEENVWVGVKEPRGRRPDYHRGVVWCGVVWSVFDRGCISSRCGHISALTR